MTSTEKTHFISDLHKVGVPTVDGNIFTEKALRQMASQKPATLRFDESKQVLLGSMLSGIIDESHWQSQKIWYKPWTWRLQPIKVIDRFTVRSIGIKP